MQVNVGKGIELDIDHAALPQTAMDHVIMIGLRNILMDSHASITRDSIRQEFKDETMTDDELNREVQEQARAMVDKKLAALMRGEVRVQSTREGDPVRAEAMRMATETIKAALRKAGRKVADVDAKALREKATSLITPELLAKAKARVEETRAADAVDLSDLGL